MFRIARAALSLQTGQIETYVTAAASYRAEHIGGEMMQTALIHATGLPLESIGLLPIGALLLAITYYALAMTVSGSRVTAVFITLYASFYYPRLFSQYGTQTYVWTNVLFLNFLLLLFLWMRKKTAVLSLLMLLLFTATFLHYHTTPIWIIIALMAAIVGQWLQIKIKRRPATHISWALPVFCTVLYLQFDTIIYGNGLARLKNDAVNESFAQSIASKFIAPLIARTPDSLDPFVAAQVNPRIATWSTLAVLVLLTAPVGIWCVHQFIRVIKKRGRETAVLQTNALFGWIIIFIAVGHAILYSFYGALSLRVIPLAFPILIPIVVQPLRNARKVEHVWAFALAAAAIIGFSSYAPTLTPDVTATDTGIAAQLMPAESRILSDPNAYGSLLLNAAEQGHILDFVWPDPASYQALVGQVPLQDDAFDYFVADTSGKLVTTTGWGNLEPWVEHLPTIQQNASLNQIYDNGRLQIFQPNQAQLPTYAAETSLVEPTQSAWWENALWLFIGVSTLLFLPGLISLLILNQAIGFKFDSPLMNWGVSMGISIAFTTIIGYLVNFSPLRLDWQVVLVGAIPFIIFILFLLARRGNVQFNWSQLGAGMFLLLIGWSLIGAAVSQQRLDAHKSYSEFFITQDGIHADDVRLTVISRLPEAESFSVAMQMADETAVTLIDSIQLQPNSSWSGTISGVDAVDAIEPIRFVLMRGDDVYRSIQLHPQAR